MVELEETNQPNSGSANASADVQTSIHELRPDEASRDVFVVHGRNLAVKNEVFTFLRALDLRPLEWPVAVQLTGKPAPYIGEILDAAFSRAHAIVVLFTPDDIVRLRQELWDEGEHTTETETSGQARPNVFFEAGMAMGRSEDRTVLVEVGTVKRFSDIEGRHVIRLNNSSARRQELAQRLRSAGCPVNLDGTEWHSAGDFEFNLAPIDQDQGLVQSVSSNIKDLLPKEAIKLLVAAANDAMGIIQIVRLARGTDVVVGNTGFVDPMEPRVTARWEGAISDLYVAGLISMGPGGEYYEVTREGYDFADGLGPSDYED